MPAPPIFFSRVRAYIRKLSWKLEEKRFPPILKRAGYTGTRLVASCDIAGSVCCILCQEVTVDVMIPKVVDVDILSGSDIILANNLGLNSYNIIRQERNITHSGTLSTPDTIEPG